MNASWKNRTYAYTFPVQRKEISVVKVRFAMRYSSRKLSNYKVMTTAWNFWRQIACSFQAMSGNILFLGNKIFEIPPFFQTRSGDLGKKVHACSLRFSALKIMIMIVAPWCARNLCFLVLWNISIALIHGNKHQNLVISLAISSQVMKPDFLVARATSKTFKNILLIQRTITFRPKDTLR